MGSGLILHPTTSQVLTAVRKTKITPLQALPCGSSPLPVTPAISLTVEVRAQHQEYTAGGTTQAKEQRSDRV